MPIRRPIAPCSKPRRTGATAIRRWWVSIHPMDCCSMSAVARIFLVASRRWPTILLARFHRQGLRVEIGLADTVGCAWAAARYGETPLVPKGAMRDVLLPLPLAALRLDGETVSALAQAGLKRIADVVDRPACTAGRAVRARISSPARSGARPGRRIDQAAAAAAVLCRGAAVCRSHPAGSRCAVQHRAACARTRHRHGTARRRARGCCRLRCFAPTARFIGSRPEPASPCAIPPASSACSPNG